MDQVVFNIVVGVAGALSMFILAAVWSRLGKLEESDEKLAGNIAAMHILVAGEYIKRSEISPQLENIYTELKNIRADLATKVERRHE